jgi:hypothetical protein
MAPKTAEQKARRARADHAAAAIEALHSAVEHLGRALYHLQSTEVAPTALLTQLGIATEAAVKAHALARILADRIP